MRNITIPAFWVEISVLTLLLTIVLTDLMNLGETELLNLSLPDDRNKIDCDEFKNHLSKRRLNVLWNLVLKRTTSYTSGDSHESARSPRLVVITKLQDPFDYWNCWDYENFYDTFRDDTDYLYAYISAIYELPEFTEEVRILRTEMKSKGLKVEQDALVLGALARQIQGLQIPMGLALQAGRLRKDHIRKAMKKKQQNLDDSGSSGLQD